jgi:cytochrome c-type biogenesis protein
MSSTPVRGNLIVDVSHEPTEPIPGQPVLVNLTVTNHTDIQFVEIQYCTFDPYTCKYGYMEHDGNESYLFSIPGEYDDGEVMGYNITLNATGHTEYFPQEGHYVNITYEGEPLKRPPPSVFTTEFLLVEGLLLLLLGVLVGVLVWRKLKGLETSKVAVIGVVFIIIFAFVYGALQVLTTPSEITLAKDFTDVDTDGNLFNLSDFRDEVVIIDFMSINCGGCEIIAEQLKLVHSELDNSDLEIISIDISKGDTMDALGEFRASKGYPWRMALNSSLLHEYALKSLPTLVIVDKEGFAVDVITDSNMPASEIERRVNDALAGRSQAIGIKASSGLVLAAFAGFATFFSPCSFPMLPGFVAFYLSSEAEQKKKSSLRVLASGLVAGSGIILVFVLIGLIWIATWIAIGTASNVEEYTPILGLAVGVILIVLGGLMFTNIQYHALIKPFSRLKQAIFKGKGEEGGYFGRLFAYGVGYGAAASACTAPLFIGVLVDSSVSGGAVESVLVLLIFSLMIILLMVVITFMLSAFGQESVRKLSQYTDLIKKVSAVVLVVVGVYLIYYYITTHVI